ncbi:MAG: FtsX-like permease family protein, partial [Bacteroidota bacterium]
SINHRNNDIKAFGYFTEPSFFEVFDFKLESGTPNILNEPGKVIITKELATKLYDDQPAVNKVIESKTWGKLQIAGVLEKFPQQTHLAFDMLVGFPTSDSFESNLQFTNWVDFTHSYYYFAVPASKKRKLVSQMNELGKLGDSAFEKEDIKASYTLQPLLGITPGPQINDGIGIQFDMPTMILFFGISLLILLPACFNYTNMSIAIALKRAKEVGIRKTMGSHSKQIIHQFLVETVLICLCAVIISGVFFIQIREAFTQSLAGGTALSFEVSPTLITAFIGFAILTGILTGLGPALYFAKISPIQALRSGRTSDKISISRVRKGLLVFQFALTLIFMIGVGALLKQYQDARSFELPFNTDDTFIVYTQETDTELLKTSLASEARISGLSFSSSIPGTSLTKNA